MCDLFDDLPPLPEDTDLGDDVEKEFHGAVAEEAVRRGILGNRAEGAASEPGCLLIGFYILAISAAFGIVLMLIGAAQSC
ncbi:MAG: hypothetical protein OXC19_14535 [Bryobacterales bacterium]|nr:hypothetical protein [Bryobacterales bacterium]